LLDEAGGLFQRLARIARRSGGCAQKHKKAEE
jgi:hypothetical protein